MPKPFGPQITFLGVANGTGAMADSTCCDSQGRTIFARPAGFGFLLVVEGARGTSGSPLGQKTLNSDPGNPAVRPDIQMLVDTNLGNGSPDVCDEGGLPEATPGQTPSLTPIPGGGVPARPLTFDASQATADALNDLGCRFDTHLTPDTACTIISSGNGFLGGNTVTEVQFCAVATRTLFFQSAHDTVVSVQLVDTAGHIGERKSFVVRVQ